ncbi:hypothetical protein [Rhodoplanes serenus]|uniref:hypothetical protein n=1 Tax=Rhodoplanes serenus TaxID=200615 RepID=UPI000DAC1B08|nr:hypothetical protein [Rhodoplanes serenus]RAI32541.1 hypothetical protein CH340_15110 [Rhodoplanes serenus]
MDLRLRRTDLPTPSGEPPEDDYSVVLNGLDVVGRIMRVRRAGTADVWFWSIMIFPNTPADRGDAETLDAAKSVVRARLEAMEPFDPERMVYMSAPGRLLVRSRRRAPQP